MAAQGNNWELGPLAEWREKTGGQPTKFSIFHGGDQKALTIEPPEGENYKPLTIQSDGTVDATRFTGDGSALKIDRETIKDILAKKVDTTSFNTALKQKVDNQEFSKALAEKIDKLAFIAELSKKVNSDRGQIKQENWYTVKIHNAWKTLAGYNPPGYFKDSMGVVHLRGYADRVKPTSSNQASYEKYPLFILPQGYRPEYLERSPSRFGADIDNTGKILVSMMANTIILDGITFRAK